MRELRTIDRQARLTPDKPAVVMAHDGCTVTFAELVERSARAAHLLRRLGLRPGDGIAVLMENNPRYFDVCWAAQRSGLHYTTINWHLAPDEARYVLEDSGSKVLVSSPAWPPPPGRLRADCRWSRATSPGIRPGYPTDSSRSTRPRPTSP